MSSVWGRGKRKASIVRTGSPWENAKLDALATYLRSYTIAGLQTPGTKTCIEAFVGAGYRDLSVEGLAADTAAELVMPVLGADEPQALLAGVARVMLETNPAFHAYVFLDRLPARRTAIEAVSRDPHSSVRAGVAREELAAICSKAKGDHRAVLFLDPFGMDVDWPTITAIAQTQAIDLWLLYPLGVGAARLAAESGDLPLSLRRHVDHLLGSDAWHADFLRASPERMLFRDERLVAQARAEALGRHVVTRLKESFPVVADQAAVLRDADQQPLYLCCFAAGNATDATLVRSANVLLGRLGS